MTGAVLTGRVLLALIFAVAGAAKLADLRGSRRALLVFGVPEPLATPLGVALPVIELGLAGLLLIPTTAPWAAAGTFVLLTAFCIAIAVAMARGERPDCHCFGQLHSAPAGWGTLLRDLALAGIAAFVGAAGLSDHGPSAVGWVAGLSSTALVAMAVAAILTVVLAFQAWFSLELLRQNGRLVLRLDAIEGVLARSDAGPPGMAAARGVNGNGQHTAQPDWRQLATGLGFGRNGHSHLASASMPGLSVGAPAPEFALPDIDGAEVTLHELRARGRPVLLVFSDPGCGPCSALLPRVAEWQHVHVATLTIALLSRGGVEQNRAKVAEHDLDNLLVQADREIGAQYQVHGTPAAVLIDPSGQIASPVAQGADAIEALVGQVVVGMPTLGVHHQHGRHPAPPSQNGNGAVAVNATRTAVGEPAPALMFADIDGQPVSVSDFAGRELVVLFWNPRCGFCERMLPELRAWEVERPAGAPELLIISAGEPEANRAMRLISRIVLDHTFAAGRAFGASGTPSAIRVDTDGRIAASLAVGAPSVLSLLDPAAPPPVKADHAFRP